MVLAAALALSSMQTLANPAYELAGITTDTGAKRSFMASTDNVALPVTVINGEQDGPVLLLTAGIHGDEFPSMLALQELNKQLKPEQISGTVVIVHLANPDGFHGRRLALNPKDEKNLNREFPGSDTGTPTEQIAAFLTSEFIAKADFLVDMHSGSRNQQLLSHVYAPFVGDPELDALTLRFAKATGMQNIVLYGDRPRDPDNSISYPNTAMTRGKPGLTTEIGHLGQTDQAFVEEALTVAKNTLFFLEILPGKTSGHPEQVIYDQLASTKSQADGFFRPLASIGDKVKKGDRIGYVTDYYGNEIESITAAATGTILMINDTPPIKQGESTVTVGIVEK